LPGDDTLHLCVLGLELLESNHVAYVHPGVFSFPKPDGVGVNAVAAGEFLGRNAGIVFSNDIDDLRLGELLLRMGWISLTALWAEIHSYPWHPIQDLSHSNARYAAIEQR